MSFLKTDIRGQIQNTELSSSKGIWALYEAIVNSIQALDDYPLHESHITITAKREVVYSTKDSKYEQYDLNNQRSLMPYESFEITDNGCGFNNTQYDSFLTANSTLKIAKGCKGIGRFLWLKAFKKASIISNYQEDDLWFCRTFDFDESGISPIENNAVPSEVEERKTTIILHDFQKNFQKDVPKKLEGLADRIVEHCLTFFILNKCPRITLTDDVESITLDDYYNTHIRENLKQDSFIISNRSFTIYHLQIQKNVDAHKLHLCANDREVRSVALTKSIPNLHKKIRTTAGEEFFYAG